MLALSEMESSKTNPRKHIDQAALEDLCQSVAVNGILQPLLVRPQWCIGWMGDDDTRPLVLEASPYEVIAGGRRHMAAQLCALELVPCIVRLIGDPAAMEIQCIENLLREDLNPVEEAESFAGLLALKKPGTEDKMYIVRDVAAKVGCSENRITNSLRLLKVGPDVRAALESGQIGTVIGGELDRIKDLDTQKTILGKILKPEYGNQPLSKTAALDLIKETVDDSEEALVYAAWKEINHKPEEKLFCLSRKDSDVILRSNYGPDELPWNTPYVKLGSKPSGDLLKKGQSEKTVQPWSKMVKDSEIKVYLARTKAGKNLELVERKSAIAAAISAGYSIFKEEDKAAKPKSVEERKLEVMAHALEVENLRLVAGRIRDELVAVAEKGMTLQQRRDMMEWAVITSDGDWFVDAEALAKLRNLDTERKLASAISGMTSGQLDGLLIDFFLGGDLVQEYGVLKIHENLQALAKILGVDIKKINAQVYAESAAAKSAQAKVKFAEAVKVATAPAPATAVATATVKKAAAKKPKKGN